MHPLTVVRQQVVHAPWEECWRCLVTPAIVSEWFATSIGAGHETGNQESKIDSKDLFTPLQVFASMAARIK